MIMHSGHFDNNMEHFSFDYKMLNLLQTCSTFFLSSAETFLLLLKIGSRVFEDTEENVDGIFDAL